MSKFFRIVVDGVEYHVEVEELSADQQAALSTESSGTPSEFASPTSTT